MPKNLDAKSEIIKRFMSNVKGESIDVSGSNIRHDGKEGHWLERKMGIKANNRSASDLLGYEMKKDAAKITFGDWSANYYLFKDSDSIDRETFLKIFGKKSHEGERWSWSGIPVPKINKWNSFGQRLSVTKDKSIIAEYFFEMDERPEKKKIIPIEMQRNLITLAKWDSESLEKRLNAKFGDKGWFICMKNQNGTYDRIGFGDPISFDGWIALVKSGKVYFDSGMYHDSVKPNNRPYSQWRANGDVWHSLITEVF